MSILIEKDLKEGKFSRKQLKKVKEVPSDLLESILEKVEIMTCTKRLSQIFRGVSFFKLSIIVGLASMVIHSLLRTRNEAEIDNLKAIQKSIRRDYSVYENIDVWITKNQQWLHDYFDESSDVTFKSMLPSDLEFYRGRVKGIMDEMEITDVIQEERLKFTEGKTIEMVGKVLLSTRKKHLVKCVLCLLVAILCFGVYFSSMFMKTHNANIYKNVSAYLSFENESYFCKKGYYWSIDEKMTTLKLSKIYIRVGRRKTNEQAPKQKVQVVSLQISRSDSGNTPKQDQKDGSNEEMQMQVRERSRSPAPRHTQLQQPYNPYMMYMQPGMHHHIGQMHPQFNPTFQHIPQMHLSGHPGQQGQLSHPGLPGHPYAPYYHYATQANFDIHNNIHHHTPPHDGEALEHDNANDDGQDAGDTEAFSDSYCDDSKPQAANQIPSKHRSHNRSRKGGQRVMTYAFTHRSDA